MKEAKKKPPAQQATCKIPTFAPFLTEQAYHSRGGENERVALHRRHFKVLCALPSGNGGGIRSPLSNLISNMMIRQCAILFGCLAIGELIVYLTGVKLPSSIIGMLCLTLFLKLGWVKLQWVQGMSDFLVANLGFFFVPPGVALMLHFRVISAEWLPIVTASVISTLLVLIVTGWVHQLTRKIK